METVKGWFQKVVDYWDASNTNKVIVVAVVAVVVLVVVL